MWALRAVCGSYAVQGESEGVISHCWMTAGVSMCSFPRSQICEEQLAILMKMSQVNVKQSTEHKIMSHNACGVVLCLQTMPYISNMAADLDVYQDAWLC